MRKRLLTCVLSMLALLTVGESSALSEEPLKFGVGLTSDHLASYMADDQNLFAKHGLNVKVETMGGSASTQFAALVSGSIDVLAGASPLLIQAVDAGLPLTAIAGGSVLPTSKLGIIARKDSGIKTPADLVGKRVAVSAMNGILHLAARNWLSENGVDYDAVKWVEVFAPQQIDLMKSGEVDAAVMGDPYYTAAVNQGVGYEAGMVYENAPDGTAISIYMTRKQWADEHPEELKKLREALSEAAEFARNNVNESMASLAKHTKLPPATLALLTMPHIDTKLEPAQMNWWINVLKKQDTLTGDVDSATLVHN